MAHALFFTTFLGVIEMTQHPCPNANWTLEQLTEYVRSCIKSRDDMTKQVISLRAKSAVEIFRAGQALQIIRDKLKAQKAYVQWLEDEGICRTTAHEAIKLVANAKTEKAVEKMAITEAKELFGVIKPKSEKSANSANKQRNAGSDETSDVVDDDADLNEITRVDEVLLAMKRRLQEVVQWDRSDMNADDLDRTARNCIDILNVFLIEVSRAA